MDGLNELLNKYMLFASQEVHVGKNCAGQDLGQLECAQEKKWMYTFEKECTCSANEPNSMTVATIFSSKTFGDPPKSIINFHR